MPSTACARTLATALLAALSAAAAAADTTTALPQDWAQGQAHQAQGSARVGGCHLACRWSSRLCRLCHTAAKWPQKLPAWFPTTTPPEETTTDDTDETTETIVFPDTLPEGTTDAMLETASHILSIVAREDSERIRIWLENPERNGDNLDRLAGKLSSFPRAPYGRAYWRLVLRSSRDRPFTLLREALALRAAYQSSSSGSSGSSSNNSSTESATGAGDTSSTEGSTEGGTSEAASTAGGDMGS